MLDLTLIQEKFMEIKMLDGQVLQLRKPTQKMLKYLTNAQKFGEGEELDRVAEIVTMIINHNKEGIVYKKADMIINYELDIMIIILNEYSNFIKEVMSNPN